MKQKFCAINDHFENTRKFFDLSKKEKVSKVLKKSPYGFSDDENDLPGYLHKEILCKPVKRNRKNHRIDEITISGRIEQKNLGVMSLGKALLKEAPILQTNQFEIDDKMDKKLTNLCQLHDQICEIGMSFWISLCEFYSKI